MEPSVGRDPGLAHRAKGEIEIAIADYTHAIELNPQQGVSRSKAFDARGELTVPGNLKKAIEIGRCAGGQKMIQACIRHQSRCCQINLAAYHEWDSA